MRTSTRLNGRRHYCAELPRRNPGRPDRQYAASVKYATAKLLRDDYWHGTTAPKAKFFSRQTYRRVVADMIHQGLLERKRSQDPGNRRSFVVRRTQQAHVQNERPQRPEPSTHPGAQSGGTKERCAQNSPTPIGPKWDALADTRCADLRFTQPGTLKHPEIPRKLRQIACGIRDKLYRWHRDQLGHYPYRVRFVPGTVWCYAAWALKRGFNRKAIIRTYQENALDGTMKAREQRDNESPALTVWRSRRELELSRGPAKPPTQPAHIHIRQPTAKTTPIRLDTAPIPRPVPACDPTAARCWAPIGTTIRRGISTQTWDQWFKNLTPTALNNQTLTLTAHTTLQAAWIKESFGHLLKRSEETHNITIRIKLSR